MSYGSNYYNYQIGVIFAILIGGVLLLVLLVGAIYFLCVTNMRGDKNRRAPSSAGTSRRPEYGQPPYSTLQNQPTTTQPEYVPRGPLVSSGVATPYNQSALVQPYTPEAVHDARIRPLQPEFAYQQGPMTWTTMSPVHEAPYPMSPPPAQYHQSSV